MYLKPLLQTSQNVLNGDYRLLALSKQANVGILQPQTNLDRYTKRPKNRWYSLMLRKKWVLKSNLLSAKRVRRYRLVTKNTKNYAGVYTLIGRFKEDLKKRGRLKRLLYKRTRLNRRTRWKVKAVKEELLGLRKHLEQPLEKNKFILQTQKSILTALKTSKTLQNLPVKRNLRSKIQTLSTASNSLAFIVSKHFTNYKRGALESSRIPNIYTNKVYRKRAKIRLYKAFFNKLRNSFLYKNFTLSRFSKTYLYNCLVKVVSSEIGYWVANTPSVKGIVPFDPYTKTLARRRLLKATSPRTNPLHSDSRIQLKSHNLLRRLFTQRAASNLLRLSKLRGVELKYMTRELGLTLKSRLSLVNFSSTRSKLYQSPLVKKFYTKKLKTSVPTLLDSYESDSWSYGWATKSRFADADFELDHLKTLFWGYNSLEYLKYFTGSVSSAYTPYLEYIPSLSTSVLINLIRTLLIQQLPYKAYFMTTMGKISSFSETISSGTIQNRRSPFVTPDIKTLEHSFIGSYSWDIATQTIEKLAVHSIAVSNNKLAVSTSSCSYYNVLIADSFKTTNIHVNNTILILTRNIENTHITQLNYLARLKNQLSANRAASIAAYSLKRYKSGERVVRKPTVFTYQTPSYTYLLESNLSTIRNRNYFYWNTSVASASLHATNGVLQTPSLLNWNDDHWENSIYLQPRNLQSNPSPYPTMESKIALLASTTNFTGGNSRRTKFIASTKPNSLKINWSRSYKPTTLLSKLLRFSKGSLSQRSEVYKRVYKTLTTRIKSVIYRKKALRRAPPLRLRLRRRSKSKALSGQIRQIRQYLRDVCTQRRFKKKFLRFVLSNRFARIIDRVMARPIRKIRRFRVKSNQLIADIKRIKRLKFKQAKRPKRSSKRVLRNQLNSELLSYKESYAKVKPKLTRATDLFEKWQTKFINRKLFAKNGVGRLRLSKWFLNSTYVLKYFTTRLLKKKLRLLKKVKRSSFRSKWRVYRKRRGLKRWLLTKTLNHSLGYRSGGLLEHMVWTFEYATRNQLMTSGKAAILSSYTHIPKSNNSVAIRTNLLPAARNVNSINSSPSLLANIFFLNTAMTKIFFFKYLLVRFRHETNASSYDLTINSFKSILWNFNLFYFTNRLEILQQSNIIPTPSFSFNIRRRLLKLFIFRRFPPSVSVWYFNMLVRFMESCTGRKIYLKINPHLENNLTLLDHIQCKMWEWRVASFQRVLGPKIFINESLRIILLALKYKDPTFLVNWIRAMLYRMSFWKYRTLFRYLKFVVRDLFEPNFNKFGLRGFKLRLKGKISVAGNARTRVLRMKIGQTSHSKKNNKVAHSFTLINSFTGVMGFNLWIFF